MTEPDLSEFEKLSKPKNPPCPLCEELDLSNADQASLNAALGTDKAVITNSAVAEWLSRRNIEVSYQVVAAHRRHQ